MWALDVWQWGRGAVQQRSREGVGRWGGLAMAPAWMRFRRPDSMPVVCATYP